MSKNQVSLEQIQTLLTRKSNEHARLMVAVAGPPGAGKSTFVQTLAARLNNASEFGRSCAILAMDGYHYDDIYLNQKGWRDRKGAPHTFDVGGLASILGRLRKNQESGVAVPIFDRKIEIARAGAQVIEQSVKIVLVEGNYLLLDQSPWRDLSQYFDLSVMIEAPREVLGARLRQRWAGSALSPAEIEHKVQDNDLKNVDLVLSASRAADYYVLTGSD